MDAIVLAGGASRRMGTDKTKIVVGDRTMLRRSVDALHEAGAERIVVVSRDGDTTALGTGVIGLADSDPGSGPLGALVDGLRHLARIAAELPRHAAGGDSDDVVFVLAADHPDPDPVELAGMASALVAASADTAAVIPVVDGRDQILHAPYRRWLAEPLAARRDAGERSLQRALGSHAVIRVVRTGKARDSYRDLDSPADLASYRAGSKTGLAERNG